LAEAVITQAKAHELAPAELQFNYSEHEGKVSILEPLRGQGGHLSLSLFSVESLDQSEDHLIFAAITDTGQPLDQQAAERLFSLPGRVHSQTVEMRADDVERLSQTAENELEGITQHRQAEIQRAISERNARLFEAEADKLDGWAEDLKLGLEREIKELDRQIREARRAATAAMTLEEMLAGQ
jgi:adenine-specific DNA-methyltransferase